ncbi:MAG: hypothetical protein V3W28_01625 [Thermoplasmata archaeon]
MKPANPVEGVIVVSRGVLPVGSTWVVAGEQDAKAKDTMSYVLVRLEGDP